MFIGSRGRPLGLLASFVLLHAALLLGMQRQIPLPQRVAAYPAQLLGIFKPDVLATVLPLAR